MNRPDRGDTSAVQEGAGPRRRNHTQPADDSGSASSTAYRTCEDSLVWRVARSSDGQPHEKSVRTHTSAWDEEEGTMNLILRNARIWTGDPVRPWASTLVAREGRIVAIGGSDVTDVVDRRMQELDGAGRLVIPGIVDSHNHLRLGSSTVMASLHGATTLDEIRGRIAAWLDARPGTEWVLAEGFDYAAFPEGRDPHMDDIAGMCRGLPAMLLDYSVHAVLFNREALVALGASAASPDVPYGHFEVGPDGELTGYLHDYATYGLSRAGLGALSQLIPSFFGIEAQYAGLLHGLDLATSYGITTVVEPQNSLDDVLLFERAIAEGRMRSRVIAALFHPVGTTAADRDEFQAAIAAHQDDRFRLGPIKLYIDDIVEPHTAAMLEPYANRPDTCGRTYYEPPAFDELIADLDARGLQCFVHATGDRGIRTVLDAFEHAQRVNGVRDSRHQIVHVECVDSADLGRFAALGVVPCMQPRLTAPEIIDEWRVNVGPQRWRYAWPMRSLHESGATLAFSSDWNVAEMDPMVGLYTAVTRADLDGGRSWIPEECVDVETALTAYTRGSAYANFCEHDRGMLREGYLADLAVLSGDVLSCEPSEILETQVDTTVVGGEVVYLR
jgi:predicted amidohydrolase YtcJ